MAPKKLIKFAIDCMNFESIELGKDKDSDIYLYRTVCLLIIRASCKSVKSFGQTIKDVLIDGDEYEQFRQKLYSVKDFAKKFLSAIKLENPEAYGYDNYIQWFANNLDQCEFELFCENEKSHLKEKVDKYGTKIIVTKGSDDSSKKLFLFRLAYIFLFIVAFVALFNIWLSFLTVPKIASWIVFGICFAGFLICVFFACRINSAKKHKELKNAIDSPMQYNEYRETILVDDKFSLEMPNNLNSFLISDCSYENESNDIN